MAHDVFISHSSTDKQIADAMCHKLESNGIRCWIAPRDILPGTGWGEAIVHAINKCQLMVLVFSSSANDSQYIIREVDRAASKRVPIVPFRIEDVLPSGSLEFYLSTSHWLDALTPPMEKHLNQLVESVKRHLPLPPRRTTPEQQTPLAPPAPEAPTPEAGDFPRTLKNRVGIEFVYVPAGSFMMGSESGEAEKPVHQVTIPKAFYLGKYAVTQAQWQEVTGNNQSYFKGDTLPVDHVTWNHAQEFIQKLNAMNDSFICRLPSEAEWEYACRAGTTGDYAGDLDSMAWYANNSGQQTHPVGQKQPNAFGLYDMHGNVWEWCQDHNHNDYVGAPTDGSAWLGKTDYRVSRGGSWSHDAYDVRSATRVGSRADIGAKNSGVRLVAIARS